MKISTKLRYGGLILALLPAISVGIVATWSALDQSAEILTHQAQQRLVALREERAHQIEAYFANMRKQVRISAEAEYTRKAITSFLDAFHELKGRLTPEITAREKTELAQFYREEFEPEFNSRNKTSDSGANERLDKLDPIAIAMQLRLIKRNPHPLGEKDKLYNMGEWNAYAFAHANHHKTFHEILDRFGFYDIFLIDAKTGHVVYSVFKELDYATSLNNGPYADSGLGKAFKSAMQQPAGAMSIADFEAYYPSYQNPAAFIASPVFDGSERVGVIVFQLPIDKIDHVMTGGEKWQQTGLGDSGETYLLGEDHKMRSDSRFLLQDQTAYLASLKTAGIPAKVLHQIETKHTTIGIQPINSPGAEEALSGKTGFKTFQDYRGVDVLSAYRPLKIEGLNWAILAEMDTAEAFASVGELESTLISRITLIVVLISIISTAVGFLFAGSVSSPIRRITESMNEISSGDGDLTVRLDEAAHDELGDLARAFNTFVKKIDSLVQKVMSSASDMNQSSRELSAITTDTHDVVSMQQRKIEQIASAVEELTATVKEVAHNAEQTDLTAKQANENVQQGSNILNQNIAIVRKLSTQTQASQEVIDALSKESDTVGIVLDVIRSIAEQTNLLALNAAIEAARAGEQGRGFAVVADEVRVLAQKTQESTEEIQQIIESLQKRSHETKALLTENNAELMKNAELSESTLEAFNSIAESVNHLLGMSVQIANATGEQSLATNEIGESIQIIYDEANKAEIGADQTARSGESLAKTSDDLRKLVGQFKVSKTA